ncbi:integrase catalytic domain-containing protein [Trichonephila clavipes]|nr:integrase catalytic domain-containing protein [Trichonephila clavipes]
MNNIEIPRRILVAFPEVIEIHGFADASERCYGAAVYCKSKNLKSETLVRLITSKSRVAPIKSLTIPRLELCAAVLLAKLVKRVVAALQLETAELYLWSDSKIVLAWLRKEPMDLKTFVQNRVAKIQKLYPNQLWRHVPSDQNPAYLVSREVDPDKLLQQNLWFNGPTFLSAVHIELVSDLTSQAFIATLKRFMARRGKCAKLFSDNGKNFVGASNEIKKLFEIVRKPDEKLANYLVAEGIEWKFIPSAVLIHSSRLLFSILPVPMDFKEKMADQSKDPKINPFIDLERQEKIKMEEDKLREQKLNADMKLSLGRAGVLPREPLNDVGVSTDISKTKVPKKDVGVNTDFPILPESHPLIQYLGNCEFLVGEYQWTIHECSSNEDSDIEESSSIEYSDMEESSIEYSDMEGSSSIEYSDIEGFSTPESLSPTKSFVGCKVMHPSSEEDSDIEEISVPERKVECVVITSD